MRNNVLKGLSLFLILFYLSAGAQVTLLSNNTSLTSGVVVNGRALLFSENDSLWVTNGTAAGTAKLSNLVSYVDTIAFATIFQGKVFFAGATAANGSELWATDGTAAGTVMIKDINPGAGSSLPLNFYIFNNMMFFTADNGTNGIELWMSDGTAGGTTMLKDINPGATGSIQDRKPDFFAHNGILYFIASDNINGKELWKTNGTAPGTTIVKNITMGITGTSFSVNQGINPFIALGSTVIFGVNAGAGITASFQLWKTDGSDAGTTLLKDFGSFSGSVPPSYFSFNGKIYFIATEFSTTGVELWATDGTPAGTQIIKDINPGTESSIPFLFNAIIINNKFYFQATTAANGAEIWMSDGTPLGTQMLKDINPGTGDANPFIFRNIDFTAPGFFNNLLYNGKIFFSAEDGTAGEELWITDGTATGTVLVKDINPGVGPGLTNNYFYTNNGLFFGAIDGTGAEPWLSNGTAAGTSRIADVNPGPNGSDPEFLFIFNSQLYFNASNGDHATATDLYKIEMAVLPLPFTLLHFGATVQATNTVTLDWITTNEINSSHFIVERSIDGNRFAEAGRIEAKGNAGLKKNYTFTDLQTINANYPVVYYRLKMVDKDAGYKYSGILALQLNKKAFGFTISPNPAQHELWITLSPNGAKTVALSITDMTGKQVYLQTLPGGQDVLRQNINIRSLQSGVYNIQVVTGKNTHTLQFVKQ